MAGTPKNQLNKIRIEMIKRDNKVVAQDDVKSTASQLQGGRLFGKVDETTRPWYEGVKGTKKSASVDMETVVSNSPEEEIYKRIETNRSNKYSPSGKNKSEDESIVLQKARKAVKSRQTVREAMAKHRVENIC